MDFHFTRCRTWRNWLFYSTDHSRNLVMKLGYFSVQGSRNCEIRLFFSSRKVTAKLMTIYFMNICEYLFLPTSIQHYGIHITEYSHILWAYFFFDLTVRINLKKRENEWPVSNNSNDNSPFFTVKINKLAK